MPPPTSVTPYREAGGCACGECRYALTGPPLFTHACHCLDCQRRSGSAFGLTAIVLRADWTLSTGTPAAEQTSERTTRYRCPTCDTLLYQVGTAFPLTLVLRAGTLDEPAAAAPDAHIWTSRKLDWIELPAEMPVFREGYDSALVWPASSLARLANAAQDLSKETSNPAASEKE